MFLRTKDLADSGRWSSDSLVVVWKKTSPLSHQAQHTHMELGPATLRSYRLEPTPKPSCTRLPRLVDLPQR